MIKTLKQSSKGVLTIGTFSWLIYYQHLEDTGGDEPFTFGNTRLVRSIKIALGQAPPRKTFEVIHGQSDFAKAIL